MRAVAHSAPFAKKVGIPQNVGMDFAAADAAKKGTAMARKTAPFMGKESAQEETKEKKKFPGKKAYAKAEAKYEGEKYACGGKVKRRYADGGDVPDTGRWRDSDPDIYTRARKFVESGDTDVDEAPKAKPKSAVKPSARRAAAATPKTESTSTEGTKQSTAKAQDYTPAQLSDEEMNARARKESIQPDTTLEETLLGGKLLKAAGKGISRMMNKPATSASRDVATKYDEVTPIPNRAPRVRTEAIEGPKPAGRSLPSPDATPRLGGPSNSARTAAEDITPRLPRSKPAAPKREEAPMSKTKTSPRARSKFNEDESGAEFKCGGNVKAKKMASGGSVRGVGIAKRGFGRGIMR